MSNIVIPYIKLDIMCHTRESQSLEDCGAEYVYILKVSETRPANVNIFSIAEWYPHNLPHLSCLTLNCGTVNVVMMEYKSLTEMIHNKYRGVHAQVNQKADHQHIIDTLRDLKKEQEEYNNLANASTIQEAIEVVSKQHYYAGSK